MSLAYAADMEIAKLSDQELLSNLRDVCLQVHRVVASIVVYLAEVEERRLHIDDAYSSLFDFCKRHLGMSSGEAYRRVAAAHTLRRFPRLLPWLERGDIRLSGLSLMHKHLTEKNFDALMEETKGKSTRAVAAIVAERFPKAAGRTKVRKLPDAPTAIDASPIKGEEREIPDDPASRAAAADRALAEARYKIEFTASRDLCDKLKYASDLMGHQNPSGDLVVLIEEAVDLLISRLEQERFAKTDRPLKKARTSAKPGHISDAVRREVWARDGGQCTYAGTNGRRCPARKFIEYHHKKSRASGGKGDADNICLLCRAHNRRLAEREFGREHVARRIRTRQESARKPQRKQESSTAKARL